MSNHAKVLIGLAASTLLFATTTASSVSSESSSGRANVIPGQFEVRFDPSVGEAQRLSELQSVHARVLKVIPELNAYTIALPQFQQENQITSPLQESEEVGRLTAIPGVAFAEPNEIYHALSTTDGTYIPNDPKVKEQWAWKDINAFQGWALSLGDPKTVIGIVDTGVDPNHPDLKGKVLKGYNIVDSDTDAHDRHGHGTHTAGSAAAITNNKIGGAGMCPKCSILPVRVLDEDGGGSTSDVAQGILWAADHGANVINLSLGGDDSDLVHEAVDHAWKKGAFVVCAAGNDSTSDTDNAFPAPYSHCFSVAATQSNGKMAEFSNYGDWVKVAAPGNDIYSTWMDGKYETTSGTSMSAPFVSGVAGLLFSEGLKNDQIAKKICDTAKKVKGTEKDWKCGEIDVGAAMHAAKSGGDGK